MYRSCPGQAKAMATWPCHVNLSLLFFLFTTMEMRRVSQWLTFFFRAATSTTQRCSYHTSSALYGDTETSRFVLHLFSFTLFCFCFMICVIRIPFVELLICNKVI
ncbi:hypothetical protein GDO78_013021 [Eleutherodactylus coqui]|uniref:Uncharacterized protein n=1 Tax=Eleutherodactylus coqui TaxID=57060 RepID=A0A8J6EYL3_ELECQ|nr:hypothetical protein GDO78_013021 [Eleutherodactylus coqui]